MTPTAPPVASRLRDRPPAVVGWVLVAELAALTGPWWAPWVHADETAVAATPHWVTLLALIGLQAGCVEVGRWVDGRSAGRAHRAHKGLSGWAFAGALLLPPAGLLVAVAAGYAVTRLRGLRLPLWKWIGSAAYVLLACQAAMAVLYVITGPVPRLPLGGREALGLSAAVATYLAVQALLFAGSAWLNSAADEQWLRATLRSPRFHLTEATVVTLGALVALLWATGPWALVLTLPVLALTQQALLSEPLRDEARTDGRTGLLRYEAWRQLAETEHGRLRDRGRPWAVLFADLDHFKVYNDRHGHLAGDLVLTAVGELLRQCTRSRDVLGRFGGEEFSLLLPDTALPEALAVAERIRRGVEEGGTGADGTELTVSVGVAAVGADVPVELVTALQRADEALYAAKQAGRNQVLALSLTATGDAVPHGWMAPAPVRLPRQRRVVDQPHRTVGD